MEKRCFHRNVVTELLCGYCGIVLNFKSFLYFSVIFAVFFSCTQTERLKQDCTVANELHKSCLSFLIASSNTELRILLGIRMMVCKKTDEDAMEGK
jgi:hypothetical protein